MLLRNGGDRTGGQIKFGARLNRASASIPGRVGTADNQQLPVSRYRGERVARRTGQQTSLLWHVPAKRRMIMTEHHEVRFLRQPGQ